MGRLQGRPDSGDGAAEQPRADRRPGYLRIIEFVLPGLALIGIFFVAQVALGDIFTERSRRTMARLFTAPVSVEAFLAAKAAGGIVTSLCALILLQLFAAAVFGTTWGPPGLVLVVDCVAVVGFTGVCLLIFSLVKTSYQADTLLSAVILFMALFGGSVVPMMMLPPAFTTISQFTVNAHVIAGFNCCTYQGTLLPAVTGLIGVGALGLASAGVGVALLRRQITRGL